MTPDRPASAPSDFQFTPDSDLQQLHKLLSYEMKTSFLFLLVFFGPFMFVLRLAFYAALAVSPYIMWKLYRMGRWRWVVGFLIAVVLPWFLAQGSVGSIASYFFTLAPLVLFYAYTWVLKLATAEWLEAERGQALLAHSDRKRDAKVAADFP